MDKEKVVDLITYRKETNSTPLDELVKIEDLGLAIRFLIQRLRDSNPLKQTG